MFFKQFGGDQDASNTLVAQLQEATKAGHAQMKDKQRFSDLISRDEFFTMLDNRELVAKDFVVEFASTHFLPLALTTKNSSSQQGFSASSSSLPEKQDTERKSCLAAFKLLKSKGGVAALLSPPAPNSPDDTQSLSGFNHTPFDVIGDLLQQIINPLEEFKDPSSVPLAVVQKFGDCGFASCYFPREEEHEQASSPSSSSPILLAQQHPIITHCLELLVLLLNHVTSPLNRSNGHQQYCGLRADFVEQVLCKVAIYALVFFKDASSLLTSLLALEGGSTAFVTALESVGFHNSRGNEFKWGNEFKCLLAQQLALSFHALVTGNRPVDTAGMNCRAVLFWALGDQGFLQHMLHLVPSPSPSIVLWRCQQQKGTDTPHRLFAELFPLTLLSVSFSEDVFCRAKPTATAWRSYEQAMKKSAKMGESSLSASPCGSAEEEWLGELFPLSAIKAPVQTRALLKQLVAYSAECLSVAKTPSQLCRCLSALSTTVALLMRETLFAFVKPGTTTSPQSSPTTNALGDYEANFEHVADLLHQVAKSVIELVLQKPSHDVLQSSFLQLLEVVAAASAVVISTTTASGESGGGCEGIMNSFAHSADLVARPFTILVSEIVQRWLSDEVVVRRLPRPFLCGLFGTMDILCHTTESLSNRQQQQAAELADLWRRHVPESTKRFLKDVLSRVDRPLREGGAPRIDEGGIALSMEVVRRDPTNASLTDPFVQCRRYVHFVFLRQRLWKACIERKAGGDQILSSSQRRFVDETEDEEVGGAGNGGLPPPPSSPFSQSPPDTASSPNDVRSDGTASPPVSPAPNACSSPTTTSAFAEGKVINHRATIFKALRADESKYPKFDHLVNEQGIEIQTGEGGAAESSSPKVMQEQQQSSRSYKDPFSGGNSRGGVPSSPTTLATTAGAEQVAQLCTADNPQNLSPMALFGSNFASSATVDFFATLKPHKSSSPDTSTKTQNEEAPTVVVHPPTSEEKTPAVATNDASQQQQQQPSLFDLPFHNATNSTSGSGSLVDLFAAPPPTPTSGAAAESNQPKMVDLFGSFDSAGRGSATASPVPSSSQFMLRSAGSSSDQPGGRSPLLPNNGPTTTTTAEGGDSASSPKTPHSSPTLDELFGSP